MARLIEESLTEEAVRKQYDETIANQEGPLEVRASHILVENEQEGADIIKALEGGADFAELARERSTGPSAPRRRSGLFRAQRHGATFRGCSLRH